MRLDRCEKKALAYALRDFEGDAYLFGSRVDATKKGGDIDLLLIPQKRNNPLKLSMQIEAKFFSLCEEKIDVVIYTNNSFCKEIIKHAKRLDIARL
ncbi:MAG: nucleotidyltransferase domain-containing protein [Planctomycetota bacterium]|jgi:predicted nucleotidyltransferase